MDKRDWIITSCKKCQGSRRISLYDSTNILLEDVMAHNIELLIHLGKKSSKIKLNGVPVFLIEAFDWLVKNNSFQVEGIFRREGNANRMKNTWRVFCGLSPIPADCNVHDVCSLIKRFFREIKKPIFTENESKILNFAEDFKDHLLADALFTVIERLPTSHVATLAYLTRQLKRVSESSDANQMNLENLATVFAPSLFREEFMGVKKKNISQHEFLTAIRKRNNLQIAVIKLLVQKSNLIGVQQSSRLLFRQETCSKSADLPRQTSIAGCEDKIVKLKTFLAARRDTIKPTVMEMPAEITKPVDIKKPLDMEKPAEVEVVAVQAETNLDDKEMSSFNFSQSDTFKEHIISCNLSKDLPAPSIACDLLSPISNRPSLAYFQRNNRGFVKHRIATTDIELSQIISNVVVQRIACSSRVELAATPNDNINRPSAVLAEPNTKHPLYMFSALKMA
uniref:Rho-GAP domain-containing protein n=1 Tax=Ditylenchus dipsaci TaxID=166011 RepID=A0A915DJ29_9BILA